MPGPTLRKNAVRMANAAKGGSKSKKVKKVNSTKAKDSEQDYNEKVTMADLMQAVGSLTNAIQLIIPKATEKQEHEESMDSSLDTSSMDSSIEEDRPSHEQDARAGSQPGTGKRLPPLAELKDQVSERLQASGLLTNHGAPESTKHKKGKGSGRTRTIQDFVKVDIDWPQYYTMVKGTPVSYDDLTFPMFIQGYMSIILKEKDPKKQAILIKHIREIAIDASKYAWEIVRDYHALLLTQMEHGELTWFQHTKIQEYRQQEVWSSKPQLQSGSHPTANRKWVPCKPFQQGKCQNTSDHNTTKGYVKHVCAFCHTRGRALRHTEQECWSKNKDNQAKN